MHIVTDPAAMAPGGSLSGVLPVSTAAADLPGATGADFALAFGRTSAGAPSPAPAGIGKVIPGMDGDQPIRSSEDLAVVALRVADADHAPPATLGEPAASAPEPAAAPAAFAAAVLPVPASPPLPAVGEQVSRRASPALAERDTAPSGVEGAIAPAYSAIAGGTAGAAPSAQAAAGSTQAVTASPVLSPSGVSRAGEVAGSPPVASHVHTAPAPEAVPAVAAVPLRVDPVRTVARPDTRPERAEAEMPRPPTSEGPAIPTVSGGWPTGSVAFGPASGVDAAAVVRQIAQLVEGRRAAVFELALSPPELGRVRMQLAPTEAGLSVIILAERGETADLLRRHGDDLLRELRNAGHQNVSLEVSVSGGSADGRSAGAKSGRSWPDAAIASAAPEQDAVGIVAVVELSARSGLDLRL